MKTKIKGYVARDESGSLVLFGRKPTLSNNKLSRIWLSQSANDDEIEISKKLLPELKPMKCKRAAITIEIEVKK